MAELTDDDIRERLLEISEAVDRSLNKRMEHDQLGNIVEVLTYDLQNQGKRLRPAIATLVSDTLGGNFDHTIDIATACELLHTASLMLDDTIDEDKTRRGNPAVHVAFGTGMSLMSTYILALLGLEIGIAKSSDLGQLLVGTLRKLVVGSADEIAWQGWDEKSYYRIIANKTAALFEAPAQIGCICANRHEFKELAQKYGNAIGMSYQLSDDYVDLGKSIKIGEPIGDLKNRNTTIAILHTYHNTTKPEIKMLLDLYRKKTDLPDYALRLILSEIEECKSLDYVKNIIDDYCSKAESLAKQFPKNKEREYLIRMPRYMINRQLEEIDMPDFSE